MSYIRCTAPGLAWPQSGPGPGPPAQVTGHWWQARSPGCWPAPSARAQGLGYPGLACGHGTSGTARRLQAPAPGSAGRRAVASQGPGAPRTLGSARTVATAAGLIMEWSMMYGDYRLQAHTSLASAEEAQKTCRFRQSIDLDWMYAFPRGQI